MSLAHKFTKNMTLTLMGCVILNLLSCKPRASSLDSSTASGDLLNELGLCPSDSYSPVGDYLDDLTVTGKDINEDDLEEALADSEGYMGPCLGDSNPGPSDGFGLAVNPVVAEKVGRLLWSPKVERALVFVGEQGNKLFRLRSQTRIPSTIARTSKAKMVVEFDPADFTKIYPGAKMLRMTSISVDASFISRAFELARGPVANSMVRDFDFIESLISKAEKALKSPEGLASLAGDMKTLKSIRKNYKALRFTFEQFEVSGTVPKYTDKFTVIMGHLQDGFVNSSPKEVAKNLKLLKKLGNSEQVKKQIANDLKSFTPKSPEQFKSWMNVRLRSLAADSEPGKKFLAGDYHKVRKQVSSMVTLLNAARQSGQAGLDDAYRVLTTINGKMGIIHDNLTAGKVTGALDYKNQIVEISPDIRNLIRQFVSNFHAE